MMNTTVQARPTDMDARSQIAPASCTDSTVTAGMPRHSVSVTEAVSSTIRLRMSPVCNASCPVRRLSICRSKRALFSPLRKRISVRLPSRVPAADSSGLTARHATSSATSRSMSPPPRPVAASIRHFDTHTENRDTPAWAIPVRLRAMTGRRYPPDTRHSHLMQSFVLIFLFISLCSLSRASNASNGGTGPECTCGRAAAPSRGVPSASPAESGRPHTARRV